MTKDELLERIMQRLPQPAQIKWLDTTSQADWILFTYRDKRYRVHRKTILAEEHIDAMWSYSQNAIQMENILTAERAAANHAPVTRRRIGARGGQRG